MRVSDIGEDGRRRLSVALAVIGAFLALTGGTLLYLRENIFDRDAFADRAEVAFSDQRVRLAVSQPVTDAIIDSGPTQLVNARPLIESVVVGALGTSPARAWHPSSSRRTATTLTKVSSSASASRSAS